MSWFDWISDAASWVGDLFTSDSSNTVDVTAANDEWDYGAIFGDDYNKPDEGSWIGDIGDALFSPEALSTIGAGYLQNQNAEAARDYASQQSSEGFEQMLQLENIRHQHALELAKLRGGGGGGGAGALAAVRRKEIEAAQKRARMEALMAAMKMRMDANSSGTQDKLASLQMAMTGATRPLLGR